MDPFFVISNCTDFVVEHNMGSARLLVAQAATAHPNKHTHYVILYKLPTIVKASNVTLYNWAFLNNTSMQPRDSSSTWLYRQVKQTTKCKL